MDGYKHYIRIDASGVIILGFSSAFPEIATVQDSDICIDENAPRHFALQILDDQEQYRYKWNGTQLVERTEAEKFDLQKYQIQKIDQLNKSCNETILAGFSSSVISATPHSYPFETHDQINMSGALALLNADSTITSITWKTLDAGNLSHTRDQFSKVCKDSFIFKQTMINKYWTLKAQVEASLNEASVNAIVW